jgi:hypothetical protein
VASFLLASPPKPSMLSSCIQCGLLSLPISFSLTLSFQLCLAECKSYETLIVLYFLHPPVASSLFGENNLLSTLFSHIFTLHSSVKVRDHNSDPYRTTGKFIILYILVFTSSYRRRVQYCKRNSSKYYQNLIYS